MKERGIIFNGDMVRAILDGRKTQTRRIVKSQPDEDGLTRLNSGPWMDTSEKVYRCPFGEVGDRLWVRETFQGPLIPEEELSEYLGANPDKFQSPAYCEYAADGGAKPEYVDADENTRYGWRPSIHMPRWASRITLEITDVRVERLKDISEADAAAEGVPADEDPYWYPTYNDPDSGGWPSHQKSFEYLWSQIYGEESWDANPWVWVIEFKRMEAGS